VFKWNIVHLNVFNFHSSIFQQVLHAINPSLPSINHRTLQSYTGSKVHSSHFFLIKKTSLKKSIYFM